MIFTAKNSLAVRIVTMINAAAVSFWLWHLWHLAMPRLDQLRPGQIGLVVKVADTADFQKLAEVGIVEGAEMEVKGLAPLRDLMIVEIGRGFTLAMRRKQASAVEVIIL